MSAIREFLEDLEKFLDDIPCKLSKDKVVQSKEMSLKETLDEILLIVFKGEIS